MTRLEEIQKRLDTGEYDEPKAHQDVQYLMQYIKDLEDDHKYEMIHLASYYD